jgi:hypothetical protein
MHQPNSPTTCDISDLLNEVFSFIQENPLWYENEDGLRSMAKAYSIIGMVTRPDMCTDEECEFVLSIHAQLQEARQ